MQSTSGNSGTRPARTSASRPRLRLDSLESREVPSATAGEISGMPIAPLSEIAVVGPQASETPPYPLNSTFKLHSRPGNAATKVIYLDFTGHTTSGTQWNFTYGSVVTPAFNFEGSPATFTTNEQSRIQLIWQRIAEDFAPFNVDVTTEDPGVEALRNTGGTDTHWGTRVVIGGRYQDWYGSAVGGVSINGSFSTNVDTPCFVFADTQGADEKAIARTASHEIGHTLGLDHDGTSTLAYFGGQSGPDSPSWAPIMGSSYTADVSQWSKGEYPDADNPEDDLAIITNATNGFGYRPDDAGGTTATAAPMTVTGSQVSFSGIIERQSDVDVLSFDSAVGNVSFDLTPYARDPNLDIMVELLDSSGAVLFTSNPSTTSALSMAAAITDFPITTAGTYYLRVSGVGAGDPLTGGYSDYGSIGQYSVSGTINVNPSLDALETTPITFVEDQGPVPLTQNATVSDDDVISGATISIVGFQPEDSLLFTDQNSIIGAYDSLTGVLTLTGDDTLSNYQDAIRSVLYDNSLANPIGGTRTITFQLLDSNGNFSVVVSRPLSVISVNDIPTIDAVNPLVIDEGAGLQTINLSNITAGGGESQNLTVTFSSDNQNLIPDSSLGLSYNSPDDIGTLTFTPLTEASGTATITVTVTDDGGMNDGGLDTQSIQISVTVNPVNDAPTFNLVEDVYVGPGITAPQTFPAATAILAGPPDESGQVITFTAISTVLSGGPVVFTTPPAIAADGTLAFTPNGTPGLVKIDVTAMDDGGTANLGDDDTSVTKTLLIYLGVNRAPKLVSAGPVSLNPVAQDTVNPQSTPVGDFSSIGVTDADGTTSFGIAVTAADNAHGAWSYSTDAGQNWQLFPVPVVAETNALLLGPADFIRFQPNGGYTGPASLTYRAWDRSSGTAGTTVNLVTIGTGLDTPHSVATGSATVRVAPVPPAATFAEDTPGNGLVLSSLAGVTISDTDPKAKQGVAVIGAGSTMPGRWEFNAGAGWKRFTGLTPSAATLLRSTDRVRFVADANQFGEAFLLFRAWDQSYGVSGTTIDLSSPASYGGQTAFSLKSDALFIRVNPVNDKPVLDMAATTTLTSILVGDTNAAGDTVTKILGATVTDPDPGTIPGLAVTGLGKTGGLGTWQYQLSTGGGWQDILTLPSPTKALLLGPNDLLRFQSLDSFPGVKTISFKAWDRSVGAVVVNPGDIANTSLTTAFSTGVQTATLNILGTSPSVAVNHAPILNGTSKTLSPAAEDTKPIGDLAGSLVTGTVTITDPDLNALKGIAVTGLTGTSTGVWQYSSNGKTWKPVGAVSSENALLLKDTDTIRYLPNLNFNGAVTATYHAWDQTRGTPGQYANLAPSGNTGGDTPFSTAVATATVTITPVNDPPVLSPLPVTTFTAITPGSNNQTGDLVSKLLWTALTDVDANALRGIAVIKAPSTRGVWSYQLNGNVNWITITGASASNAVFLRDIDRIRFTPTSGFKGQETLTYKGWDRSGGTTGFGTTLLNPTVSVASKTATIFVTDANNRPTLDIKPDVRFPAVAVNDSDPAGALASDLLGASVSDPDAGTIPGLAIIAADNKNGTWQVMVNGATSWLDIGAVSANSAVLVRATDMIRFKPKAGFVGSTSIKFKAWDGSNAAPSGNAVPTSSSAFSVAIETATLVVNTAPVLS